MCSVQVCGEKNDKGRLENVSVAFGNWIATHLCVENSFESCMVLGAWCVCMCIVYVYICAVCVE